MGPSGSECSGKQASVQRENAQRVTVVAISILKATLPASLLAGVGLVLAGVVFDHAIRSSAFVDCPQLVTQVPVLLGLKCCLEYTLASRLSTAAHKDQLPKDWRSLSGSKVARANVALITLQAMGASLLSLVYVMVTSYLGSGTLPPLPHLNLLLATTLPSATLAASFLGAFTAAVVAEASRQGVDPDLIAGPLVGGLGDTVTVLILYAASFLAWQVPSAGVVMVLMVLISLPYLLGALRESPQVARVAFEGWPPILANIFIACVCGSLLEQQVEELSSGMALLLPVINGMGGNMSSVFTSSLSTHLHTTSSLVDKKEKSRPLVTPHPSLGTGMGLLATTLLCHTFFFIASAQLPRAMPHVFGVDTTSLSPLVGVAYIGAAFSQVGLLLLTAKRLCHYAWGKGLDPDDHVLPYLNAMSDLTGTFLTILIALWVV